MYNFVSCENWNIRFQEKNSNLNWYLEISSLAFHQSRYRRSIASIRLETHMPLSRRCGMSSDD